MARPARKSTRDAISEQSWLSWSLVSAAVFIAVWTVIFFAASLQNEWPFGRVTVLALTPEILLSNIFEQSDESLPSGWRFLSQRFDFMVVAGLVWLGATALGSLLLRALKISDRDLSRVEQVAFASGIGLSLWSLLTLACGLVGWLSQSLFSALLLVSILLELSLLVREARSRTTQRREEPRELSRTFLGASLLLMLPFLVAAVLGAMLPPVDFDVKEYHLGGPKEWFLDGRVHFLPHNVYTSFPFLTEMLSLSAMVLRNDWYRGALAGQLILAGFLPLTALTIFAVGRRLFGASAGVMGAVVYVTTPWTYRIAVIAYAEGGLACYVALSVLAATVAIGRMRRNETVLWSVFLAGLFAGSGMACKYPGVVQAVIPIGLALLVANVLKLRHAPADQVQTHEGHDQAALTKNFANQNPAANLQSFATFGAIYVLGVLLAVGPWLLKNWMETGNPVYPLLWNILGGRDWDASLDARWRAAHSSSTFVVTNLFRDLLDVAVRSNWQSLLVFGFAPLSLLRRDFKPVLALWSYTLYLLGAWWFLTHRIDRFWLPLLPVVAVLAGAGVTWNARAVSAVTTKRPANDRFVFIWRMVTGIVFAVAVPFNLAVVTSGLSGPPHYLTDLDAVARVVETPNLALLNKILPGEAKVLLVGEAEIFDARFPVIYNTVFDRSIFQQWTALRRPRIPAEDWPLRSTEEIKRIFAAEGVTHIYVNWREIVRYRTTYGFTSFVTPERFRELQRRGVLGEAESLRRIPMEAIEGAAQRQEIETRFHSLILKSGGQDEFIAAELYPIASK